ncbi:hypothetical protein MU819_23465, partial [Salmonella enterica subsp. enterica serovar Enteritidis]|nr:hypothetical protein [Salmonella enterica subsp. enterica serovar Enteritidis]
AVVNHKIGTHAGGAGPRDFLFDEFKNGERYAEFFRVPLTVLELVKQKIAGPRASGVGSDFVIDDGTGKTLGMV